MYALAVACRAFAESHDCQEASLTHVVLWHCAESSFGVRGGAAAGCMGVNKGAVGLICLLIHVKLTRLVD